MILSTIHCKPNVMASTSYDILGSLFLACRNRRAARQQLLTKGVSLLLATLLGLKSGQ